MKRLIALLSTVFLVLGVSPARAINGVGVYCAWHDPFSADDIWSPENGFYRGPILKVTIQNNQVTRRDTLFKQVGEYPALSFDGKKVAFFRWGMQLSYSGGGYHIVSGTASNPCYLSVMNIDGSNLQNLLQTAAPGDWTINSEGDAVLDWPVGNWIYYEKPCKSGEIWRINSQNPSQNEKVCGYNLNPALKDGIRRWDLSLDGKWSAVQCWQKTGWMFGGITAFPLTNNDPMQTTRAGLPGCNQSVSCGGNYVAHYITAPHSECTVQNWVKATASFDWSKTTNHNIGDLSSWGAGTIVVPGHGGADLIRWSVNSEKWFMRAIGWCDQADAMALGSNTIAVNWVDHQAFNMSQTHQPSSCASVPLSECAEAGDLWIDFGAANADKWEDAAGVMHSVGTTAIGAQRAGIGDAASGTMLALSKDLAAITVEGTYRLSVLNAEGKVVRSVRGHGPAGIDLRSLESGVYFVRAVIDGLAVSERLVKTAGR